MNRPVLLLPTAIALVTMFLMTSACGVSNNGHPDPLGHLDEPSADATEITVGAADFEFDPVEITIQTGETVSMTLQNEDEIEHDLEVQGLTIERIEEDMAGGHEGADASALALHAMPGETATLTFQTDETGTFDFICTIEGHAAQGMAGTITVE